MQSQRMKADASAFRPSGAAETFARRDTTELSIWPGIPPIDLPVPEARNEHESVPALDERFRKTVPPHRRLLDDMMHIIALQTQFGTTLRFLMNLGASRPSLP
jgi:hypothetical protein